MFNTKNINYGIFIVHFTKKYKLIEQQNVHSVVEEIKLK